MSAPPDVPNIDPAEAQSRIAAGARVLDVREPEEWQAGRVDGSIWIPIREVATRQSEVPSDAEVVVVCRVGGRSAVVTKALRDAGYDAVNLAGGLQAWVADGLGLVTDDGSPGEVV